MKRYFFPIFITFLGVFTAYAFYAFWHTEEVNPPKVVEHKKSKVIEDLSDMPVIPKHTVAVPKTSVKIDAQILDKKKIPSIITKQKAIPNLTPKQIESQTQAVYDALTPEDYEETMSEADEAFEVLDTHVEEVDARLAEEMERVAEMNIEEPTEEEQNDEATEVPEDEDEGDVEE